MRLHNAGLPQVAQQRGTNLQQRHWQLLPMVSYLQCVCRCMWHTCQPVVTGPSWDFAGEPNSSAGVLAGRQAVMRLVTMWRGIHRAVCKGNMALPAPQPYPGGFACIPCCWITSHPLAHQTRVPHTAPGMHLYDTLLVVVTPPYSSILRLQRLQATAASCACLSCPLYYGSRCVTVTGVACYNDRRQMVPARASQPGARLRVLPR